MGSKVDRQGQPDYTADQRSKPMERACRSSGVVRATLRSHLKLVRMGEGRGRKRRPRPVLLNALANLPGRRKRPLPAQPFPRPYGSEDASGA